MIRIAVCVKQVPAVSMLSFDTESRRIVREGVPNEVNPFDVLAMSAAASIKQAMPAEVVAFTMGPPQAREALVQCLAMGADRAVHLVDRAFAGSDTLATARALSIALRRDQFDLIICGYNTVDSETGQVGPELAEMLDLPQVTAVSALEISDAGRGITVQRLNDEGQEEVYCALPALITVIEGVAPEVYPRRDQMDSVRGRPVEVLTASDLSADASMFGPAGSPTCVSEIYSTESSREGVVIRDLPVEEAVARLMAHLEGRAVFGDRRADEAQRQARQARGVRRHGGAGAIWVVAETLGGRVRPVSLELLGQARELAPMVDAGVEAVLIGHRAREHAAELTAYGADRVHLADAPGLDHYDTELYTGVLAEAVTDHHPYAVLIPATVNGRDLAARLAARLGLGLTGDCIGLEIDDQGRLVQLKPAFGGSIVAPILSTTMPQMATVRPGIFSEVQPDSSIAPITNSLSLATLGKSRVRVLESVANRSMEGAELGRARRIVTVGKGVGAPQNISVVRELARALDAAIGATRDVTDLGWLPRQHQIGLSGKSVAPELYIAVAVRGPFNHTVGIRKAGTVVAINNSARAPIFRSADFGILGDYAEVVPALTRAVTRRLAR
jgi:electron transfer flavoprotein alpha subunit